MRAKNFFIFLFMFALMLGMFVPATWAEFVQASQNLAPDGTDLHAGFDLIFNQPSVAGLMDSSERVSDPRQMGWEGSGQANVPPILLDLKLISDVNGIHLPDELRIRRAEVKSSNVPSTLACEADRFSPQSRDLGWSGHEYEYHAFSAEYEKLSGLEAVTLVPTPTALQGGLGGLLIVMGLTAYIRRKARMRARHRTG